MPSKPASLHDREIAAIRKLIGQGKKLLVENDRQIKRTNKSLDKAVESESFDPLSITRWQQRQDGPSLNL